MEMSIDNGQVFFSNENGLIGVLQFSFTREENLEVTDHSEWMEGRFLLVSKPGYSYERIRINNGADFFYYAHNLNQIGLIEALWYSEEPAAKLLNWIFGNTAALLPPMIGGIWGDRVSAETWFTMNQFCPEHVKDALKRHPEIKESLMDVVRQIEDIAAFNIYNEPVH